MRTFKITALLLVIGMLCACGDQDDKKRPRRYVFRAIGGASMGAMTAAQLGLRHHEEFDIISPSGGGMDLPMLIRWFTERMLGGFCTVPLAPDLPQEGMCRDPQYNQDFEAMDCGGPAAGGFDRKAMFENFQDMFIAYGNLASFSPSHHYLPFGIPPEYFDLSEEQKCAYPPAYRLEGIYDWEFNPEGRYPVITFCEIEKEDEQCVFDPEKAATYPVEIVLAVDLNDNGKRDSGEPVLFRLSERYDDFGEDGVPSSEEPGYDASSNPDPHGDDYHRLDNPEGTEDNHVYDEGEPYLDYGLDGVEGTADSPYDWGEGNGHFDYNPHVLRTAVMYDPSRLLKEMSDVELDRLDFYIDVGIRDHLGFCPSSEAFVGLLNARGRNVDIRDKFISIMKEGQDVYDVHYIDWKNIGRDLFIRYGDPDASPTDIYYGDGGHVGLGNQVIYRFWTMVNYISKRWPDGAYDLEEPYTTRSVQNETMYSEIQGKDQQYYIILPPGYDEYPDRRYPVLYLVHGIGMRAEDLTPIVLFTRDWMAEGLIQQFIIVMPDARCQEDCFSGTFMANQLGRNQEGYRYEDSFFQEFIPYIDETYRTKPPEDIYQ